MDALQLRTLIDDFYADVRRDARLGPVFERAIGADWSAHLERIHDFWSTLMLRTRSFEGNVYAKHLALGDEMTPDLFGRWLTLWQQHTERLLAADDAQALQHSARGIARHLFKGLYGRAPVWTLHGGGPGGPERIETA